MTENYQSPQTGDALFEAFVEQVKQALERLYDFAYLQQHPLARNYDGESDMSARTAGRQLRYELVTAIESLNPKRDTHFRAPDARLYNVLHVYYVENLTIQEVAAELGLSERQAYRDLKRGQESVAAVLWNHRFPRSADQAVPTGEFSLESEVARLELNFSLVDAGTIFQQAQVAVERLARQQSVDVAVKPAVGSLTVSTDPALAHQIMVSMLSYIVQQAQPGVLNIGFETDQDAVTLVCRYRAREGPETTAALDSAITKLAQRLRWSISDEALPGDYRELALRMTSSRTTILVIDDNEAWIALLKRFLEGYDCVVVAIPGGHDSLQRIKELHPSVIILDVMMPERDGWELLQRLRAQPATASVPIIVCTVFNDPQLAYSLGASLFLSKPTERETILAALKQFDII
jgi:CheY-like chemotaxis protein